MILNLSDPAQAKRILREAMLTLLNALKDPATGERSSLA